MCKAHNKTLPHGPIEEVFPDVFMVTGTMRNEFFGAMWQFSRNMTIVRQDGELTLLNAVRLDEEGLAALDALGTVKHVMQIGGMHGHDDRFYVDRYKATFWSVPGMPRDEGITESKDLVAGGELPFDGASLFVFEQTKIPEAIVLLHREGGIAIACDSLQNWTGPDAYMDESTIEKMEGMGFFAPANLGVAWMHVNEPKPGDFERLKSLTFDHALVGHGSPVKGGADAAYHATFTRLLGV